MVLQICVNVDLGAVQWKACLITLLYPTWSSKTVSIVFFCHSY